MVYVSWSPRNTSQPEHEWYTHLPLNTWCKKELGRMTANMLMMKHYVSLYMLYVLINYPEQWCMDDLNYPSIPRLWMVLHLNRLSVSSVCQSHGPVLLWQCYIDTDKARYSWLPLDAKFYSGQDRHTDKQHTHTYTRADLNPRLAESNNLQNSNKMRWVIKLQSNLVQFICKFPSFRWILLKDVFLTGNIDPKLEVKITFTFSWRSHYNKCLGMVAITLFHKCYSMTTLCQLLVLWNHKTRKIVFQR